MIAMSILIDAHYFKLRAKLFECFIVSYHISDVTDIGHAYLHMTVCVTGRK